MPNPPTQPMYRLRVGGRDGICPSAVDPSPYLHIQRCEDGSTRVLVAVYLDRLGGEIIPSRRMILNGVPQTDKAGDPKFWPSSRLLGETNIIDSLQTALLPLGPNGALIPLHIGAFARVTLARIRSFDDALDYYRQRDSHVAPSPDGLNPEDHEDAPFIPSQAFRSRTPLQSHNLPTPSGDFL